MRYMVNILYIVAFFFPSCPSSQFWSQLGSGWLHCSFIQSWPGYPGDLHLNPHALSWFSGLLMDLPHFDQQAVSNPGSCIHAQSDPTTDLLTCCWRDLFAWPWTFHVTGGFSDSLDSFLSEGVIIKHTPLAMLRCLRMASLLMRTLSLSVFTMLSSWHLFLLKFVVLCFACYSGSNHIYGQTERSRMKSSWSGWGICTTKHIGIMKKAKSGENGRYSLPEKLRFRNIIFRWVWISF